MTGSSDRSIEENANCLDLLGRQGRWVDVLDAIEKSPEMAIARLAGNKTILINLAYFGNAEVVQKLLELGADPNAIAMDGLTPLLAALDGATEGLDTLASIRLLLAAGADPNKFAYLGQSALHWAVRRRAADVVAILLEFGADPDLLSNDSVDRETARNIARWTKNQKIIDLLQ